MRSTGSFALTVVMVGIVLFVGGSEGAADCKMVNWLNHKNELDALVKDEDIKNILDAAINRLKQMDPYAFSASVLEQHGLQSTANAVDLNFHNDLKLNRFKIEGFSGIKLKHLKVLPNGDLKFHLNFTKLDIDAKAELKISQTSQSGCAPNEESFANFCYKRCADLTNGEYPVRRSSHECGRPCNSNEDEILGWCYKKCPHNYITSGFDCLNDCPKFHGSNYVNSWLFCTRKTFIPDWIPRIIYARPKRPIGVFKDGVILGCGGYGVSATSNCAYFYWKMCLLEPPLFKPPGECRPLSLTGDSEFYLREPEIEIELKVDAPECKGSLGPTGGPGGSPGNAGPSPKTECIFGQLMVAAVNAMTVGPDAGYDILRSILSGVTVKRFNLNFRESSTTKIDFDTNRLAIIKLVLNGFIKPLVGNSAWMKSIVNQMLLNDFALKSANNEFREMLKNHRCPATATAARN